jgi:hypothetical protein
MQHQLTKKKAQEKIDETLRQLEPFAFKDLRENVIHVELTPSSVKTTKFTRLWQSYAKFVLVPTGSRVLKSWMAPSAKGGQIGIYEGALNFPEICPKCLGIGTHYEITEAFIQKRTWPAKHYLKNTSNRKAQRVGRALLGDRYWHAVPFCDNHATHKRTVHFVWTCFDADVDKTYLILYNREYAQRFAELNNLEGRWINPKEVAIAGVLGLGISLSGAGVAVPLFVVGARLYTGKWPGDSGRFAEDVSNPFFVALWVVLLIVFIALLYHNYFRKKGEPIKPKKEGEN